MENLDFMRERRHSFYPTNPPHGMRNYDIGCLDEQQKTILNSKKLLRQRENELYFKLHPEVKAYISILLRHLMTTLPSDNVHEVIGEFFNRPRKEIIDEVKTYLRQTCEPIPSSESFFSKFLDSDSSSSGRSNA